jgi:hypothetical protein
LYQLQDVLSNASLLVVDQPGVKANAHIFSFCPLSPRQRCAGAADDKIPPDLWLSGGILPQKAFTGTLEMGCRVWCSTVGWALALSFRLACVGLYAMEGTLPSARRDESAL